MDLELLGTGTLKPHYHRSFPLFMVDNNVFLFQDFIFSYMHRVGFSGLYCGICRAQVSHITRL